MNYYSKFKIYDSQIANLCLDKRTRSLSRKGSYSWSTYLKRSALKLESYLTFLFTTSVVWSVYDRFNDSIHQHKYCYLFQNYTILPDDNMKYTSGHRNCSEIIPIPSENEYQPGTPGGAWNELEISITRQRILEMLKQEDETVYRNYDDTKEKGESRVTENSMIRLG